MIGSGKCLKRRVSTFAPMGTMLNNNNDNDEKKTYLIDTQGIFLLDKKKLYKIIKFEDHRLTPNIPRHF